MLKTIFATVVASGLVAGAIVAALVMIPLVDYNGWHQRCAQVQGIPVYGYCINQAAIVEVPNE